MEYQDRNGNYAAKGPEQAAKEAVFPLNRPGRSSPLPTFSPTRPVHRKKQSSVEYRVRHCDGSWRWHYSNGAPLTDADGNVVGYLGIARDITERKEIEAKLEDNERYLRTILQTTVDGVWEIDSNGRIVGINQAYCALSGYVRSEILGMHIGDLEAVETPEETAVHFQRIISDGYGLFETWHRRKDGSVFPLEVSVTLIDSRGGRMVCSAGILPNQKPSNRNGRRSFPN